MLNNADSIKDIDDTITLMAQQNLAMIEFATGRGIFVPTELLLESREYKNNSDNTKAFTEAPETDEHFSDVINLHNALSELVAPARPHAIHLLMEQRSIFGYLHGELRILGWMVVALITSLFGFICLAMLERVNAETVDISYLYLNGWTQFYVLLFLLCAATMGSSVANLFKIYQYVTAAQFEKRYEISYWVRFVLGIAAGLILAEIVPNNFGEDFTKPLIALLGGFAARVVEEILTRLVETLRTLVNGNMEARIRSQQASLNAEFELQRIRDEGRKLKALIKLRSEVVDGSDSQTAIDSIDALIDQFSNPKTQL